MTSEHSSPQLLLRRSWVVVGGAIIVAVVTYLISSVVPATYSSSAKVAVFVSGTDPNDTSLGANNLANQYAQMVGATQVLGAAQQSMHSSIPSTTVTGGTVGAQNVISISATASSASLAQQRAAAVASAFIKYISQQSSALANGYKTAANQGLAPIDAQIATSQAQLSRAKTTGESLAIASEINTLISQRAVILGNSTQTALDGRPTVRLVTAAGAGSKTAPQPKLYTLVAFIVALLLIARVVTYFGAPRHER